MGNQAAIFNILLFSVYINKHSPFNISWYGNPDRWLHLWLNFCAICYTMYVLEVPEVFVTGVTLVTFKTLTFLFYNTLFGLLVLLSILVVSWWLVKR